MSENTPRPEGEATTPMDAVQPTDTAPMPAAPVAETAAPGGAQPQPGQPQPHAPNSDAAGASTKPRSWQRTWVRIAGGALGAVALFGAGFGIGWAASPDGDTTGRGDAPWADTPGSDLPGSHSGSGAPWDQDSNQPPAMPQRPGHSEGHALPTTPDQSAPSDSGTAPSGSATEDATGDTENAGV